MAGLVFPFVREVGGGWGVAMENAFKVRLV